jgi:FdhE protein
MITIEEIVRRRPHLRNALDFYEKVDAFKRSAADLYKGPFAPGDIAYPPELLDAIFGSFSSIFDVSADVLTPLKEAMRFRQIDLSRLPLHEIPAFSMPYHEDELAGILFLISKPYFIRLGSSRGFLETSWVEGRCPVCNAVPSLSFIRQNEARQFYCSYCEYMGPWQRIGCANCRNSDPLRIEIIEIEEEKGFRIDLCNDCKSYLKTANGYMLDDYTPDLIDIVSIPLDIIAQGKGYRRHSPNPIGMLTRV